MPHALALRLRTTILWMSALNVDERDDAHGTTAVRADQRQNLVGAVDQLQRREHQFTAVLIGLLRLCVAFATAVEQISAALLEAIHGKRWPRAVAQ